MVLDLILRVCLVCPGSPFRAAGLEFGPISPCAPGSKTASAPGGATAGHGFLDSGNALCVFAWKTLGRLEPSDFAVSYGYERYRFLLANTQGKPTESQCS